MNWNERKTQRSASWIGFNLQRLLQSGMDRPGAFSPKRLQRWGRSMSAWAVVDRPYSSQNFARSFRKLLPSVPWIVSRLPAQRRVYLEYGSCTRIRWVPASTNGSLLLDSTTASFQDARRRI